MQPDGHLPWRAVLGQPFHGPERAPGHDSGAYLVETAPALQTTMGDQYAIQQFITRRIHSGGPPPSDG